MCVETRDGVVAFLRIPGPRAAREPATRLARETQNKQAAV
jgi:hypothetical protein